MVMVLVLLIVMMDSQEGVKSSNKAVSVAVVVAARLVVRGGRHQQGICMTPVVLVE